MKRKIKFTAVEGQTGFHPISYLKPKKIKSEKLLTKFIAYCVAHPGERFWQALRNWSGASSITYTSAFNDEYKSRDTFYFEGKIK